MSDSPCSVPDWLRGLIPLETPRQQEACRRHDRRYERGGDRRQRLATDLLFALDLLGLDPWVLLEVEADLTRKREGTMDPDRAEQYFWGVRQYGGFHWEGGDHGGAPPLHEPQPQEAP